MLKVVTTMTRDANGNAKFTARCNGRQLTTKRDQRDSFDRGHGLAAGALLVKLGVGADEANSPMTHEVNGTVRHTFTIDTNGSYGTV